MRASSLALAAYAAPNEWHDVLPAPECWREDRGSVRRTQRQDSWGQPTFTHEGSASHHAPCCTAALNHTQLLAAQRRAAGRCYLPCTLWGLCEKNTNTRWRRASLCSKVSGLLVASLLTATAQALADQHSGTGSPSAGVAPTAVQHAGRRSPRLHLARRRRVPYPLRRLSLT